MKGDAVDQAAAELAAAFGPKAAADTTEQIHTNLTTLGVDVPADTIALRVTVTVGGVAHVDAPHCDMNQAINAMKQLVAEWETDLAGRYAALPRPERRRRQRQRKGKR